MTDIQHFKVEWIDGGREPKVRPNKNYPHGKHLDLALGATPSCRVTLPYPAKRCGVYRVECERCGITIQCTTGGRQDDPRSVTLACRLETGAAQ